MDYYSIYLWLSDSNSAARWLEKNMQCNNDITNIDEEALADADYDCYEDM
jgi:hypothetical protein